MLQYWIEFLKLQIRRLIRYRKASLYFISNYIIALILFFTISFLTNVDYFTPADFGIVNLYGASTAFLVPILFGGVLQILNVQYFKMSRQSYHQYFTDALAIPIGGTIIFTLLALIWVVPLSGFLGVSPLFIVLIPLASFFIFMMDLIFMVVRNLNKPELYAMFAIGKNILESVLTIVFVLMFRATWNGRISASIIAPGICSLIIYLLLRNWGFITSFSNWPSIKKILFVSVPFIIERMSVFVITQSDRYFINTFARGTTTIVGLYSLGYQFATIANITILSLNNFFYPFIFNELKKNNDFVSSKVKKAVKGYLIVSLGVVMAIILAIPIIFKWFIGVAFQQGQKYALLLSVAILPWIFYNSMLPILIYYQHNKYIMYMSLAGMFFSIALNFLLVPDFGAIGACITYILVNTLFAIMTFIKVKKSYRLGF